jgi:hypothetical protein
MRVSHKFNAVRTEFNGSKYDSKKEARYAKELELRKSNGEILFYLRQVRFDLPGGTKMYIDFQEFHADGNVHFVEVKGVKTDSYKIKKREVEHHYPMLKIKEV